MVLFFTCWVKNVWLFILKSSIITYLSLTETQIIQRAVIFVSLTLCLCSEIPLIVKHWKTSNSKDIMAGSQSTKLQKSDALLLSCWKQPTNSSVTAAHTNSTSVFKTTLCHTINTIFSPLKGKKWKSPVCSAAKLKNEPWITLSHVYNLPFSFFKLMKSTREDFTIRLNCTITQWLIKSFFKFNKEADWKAEMWYE